MSNGWLALQRGIAGHEAAGPNLARELHSGKRARTIGRNQVRSPELKEMRRKLRTREGRRVSERRKALVEPVFGVNSATCGSSAPAEGSGSREVHAGCAGLQPDANVPSQTAAVSWK